MRSVAAVVAGLMMLSCGSSPQATQHSGSVSAASPTQDSVAPDTVAALPLKLKDSAFVPAHYRVADVVFGNLNLDSFPDAIVMMRHDSDDVGMFCEEPRWIYILLGTGDGDFEVKIKNKHATFLQIEGQMFGDPYDGMEIDSGTFVINHYGGSRYRWTSRYVFEYNPEKTEWYYARHYSSYMDMLMEDTTLYRDSLILKTKIAFSTFNYNTADYSWVEM